jgi:DNA polymerase-3 subunit delta
MQLRSNQLQKALAKSITPVYFISGDEPLQIGEAADAVRKAAQKAGYQTREVLTVDSSFNWNELHYCSQALSLFSEQKLVDLRLPSGKPGKEGAKVLVDYCQKIPEQTLLLISSGKVAASTLKSRWYQALDKAGVVIRVWPLEGDELLTWLGQRMQSRGLQTDRKGLQVLAARVEGNLLAAAQEVEKLYVLNGPGSITSQQIKQQVVDNSRYSVFKLVDAILAGKPLRVAKILKGLRAEAIVEPIVLWAITAEARVLAKLQALIDGGKSSEAAFKELNVWVQKKQLLAQALQRLSHHDINQILLLSAQADRQTKGQEIGDSWETILQLCLIFAGTNIFQS